MKAVRPLSVLLQQSTRSSIPSTCRIAPLSHASTRTSHNERQRRHFSANLFSPNQTITASRTLRYPSSVIYSIISDVGAYSQFLPYCQGSIVTKTSAPARDGKTYPEEAKLIIGFTEGISEEFTSRVYCVPERIVEAVSGRTETSLSGEEIAHHSPRPAAADRDPSRRDNTMAHLLTRWTLRPYPYKPPPTSALHPSNAAKNHEETSPLPSQEKTEVSLAIEFSFSNPLYAAVSQAAAPKVAEKMIEAFENRVKAVMEGPGNAKK